MCGLRTHHVRVEFNQRSHLQARSTTCRCLTTFASCPLYPRKLLRPSLTAVSALGQKLPRQFAEGVAALLGSPPRRHALPALIVINENPDLSLASYSPLHQ